MDCTPIYCFSAPKGEYLEPVTSSLPVKADGYEIRPDFISMVKELDFAGGSDENPYRHLHGFEELMTTHDSWDET